jgi:hypothetical protein
MTPINHFDQVVNLRLAKCKSADEMLEVLNQEFDLSGKLGIATSVVFAKALRQAVFMLQPPVKNGI